MKNLKSIVLLVSILGLAACGDNLSGLRPDAREQGDGPPVPDSPPGQPDGMPDSGGASTVTVAAGACPGTPDHDLSAGAGMQWTYDGGAPTQDLDITIAAGENVEFTTANAHNWESVAATGALSFTTGAPIAAGQLVCVTFTAAGGPEDFHCATHPSIMVGTVTVTP